MSDNKQKALIHICKGQLIKSGELDEAGYRGLLRRNYEVESSRDLTWEQASKFIDDLKALGGRIKAATHPSTPPRRGILPPNVTQLMSREQLRMIEHLKADLLWYAGPMGYRKWLQKFLKKDHITTSKEAQKVIEALKAMIKRQQSRQPSATEPDNYASHHDGHMSGGHYEW